MNKLQHLLLKLSEESGEIANALLNDDGFHPNGKALSNNHEINLEINDLNAIIQLLQTRFSYDLSLCHSEKQLKFKKDHKDESLFFWLKFATNAANTLSMVSSKCIQFGFGLSDPTIANMKDLGIVLLTSALQDLYFAVDCLNQFCGLGYTSSPEHIATKIEKVDFFLDFSINLKCVDSKPLTINILEEIEPIRMHIGWSEGS